MQCTQDETITCDNIDCKKCENCIAPLLCQCFRPEIVAMVDKLWKEELKKGNEE